MTRWAERDASWHDRPNVNHPARYHAIAADGRPMCGARVVLIDEQAITDDVPRKCQRCVAVLNKKGGAM